ncbi:protein DpdD [Nocardioides sp. CPCC 206347]|uniref:protein DpdD n=1 Tax=unclassified Nocardioides TaxID=2615069 RepID=UPI003607D558
MSALEEFFGDGNTIDPLQVPIELQSVIETWLTAIAQGRVGFLPRGVGGCLYWYGFAPSARGRRELLELLDGWVGPTYSDLARNRGDLDPNDPFDGALSQLPTPPVRFEVLPRNRPGSTYSRKEVRDALQMLSRMMGGRPPSEFDAPRTTVEVLDDLGHAISAQDRLVALACLRELEATADLDQTNLAFLRLRLYAGLQDWESILDDQDLPHILAMRRPLGATRVIQRAVYAQHLSAADLEGRDHDLLAAIADLPQGFMALATTAATKRRSDVVVEFLLALNAVDGSATVARLLAEAEQIEEGLADRLSRLLPVAAENVVVAETKPTPVPEVELDPDPQPEPEPTPPDPLDEAARLAADGSLQEAVDFTVTLPPSRAAARLLLFCARGLEAASSTATVTAYIDEHQLRQTLSTSDARTREDLVWLDKQNMPEKTLGWLRWFDGVTDDAGETSRLDVDAEAAADWDPLTRSEVTSLLFDCSEPALGRFGEHGGQFMAAHRHVFIEPGAAELSGRVLAGLAIGAKNSLGARVQTLALLDYLAEANPAVAVLTGALEWTGEIVYANVSALTVTWVVDVLQSATCSPAAIAMEAKHELFWHVIEAVRPYKSALDLTDLEALRVVSTELGLEVPEDLRAGRVDGEDPAVAYRYLEGQSVALYSLTEAATTRAAQILRSLLPGIDVKTNAEHVGSPKLASLSANADIFVMVAASAKHAATDFIKDCRGSKPLIHVNSRGTSAILRALAEG